MSSLDRSGARVVTMMAVGLVPLLLTIGCQPSERRVGPIHAIWVTRFDYTTADDVIRIVKNCADAGFNPVLFQVRGNGTAFYASAYEPWANELGGSDPGFDPLKLACKEAHRRGVELHAWVNVMPAWRGTEPPANREQLYNLRPEWFWYDQYGNRQALSSFYVSVNPCLPEVREYLVEVFRDLVSRYDVDGLHMDYIRFPDEPPATPRGTDIDYPHDARTLDLYRADTGLAPADDPEQWSRWRTEQVTRLVADVHRMVRETRPKITLSSAVGSVPERALRHFQDSRRWIDEGLLDAVILMNYTASPETFEKRLEPWLMEEPSVPIVPGLWFGRPKEFDSEKARAETVAREIEIALERTGNFCVFAYSSLFDSRDDQLTTQDEPQRRARAVRREVLLPFIQSLDEAGQ